MYPLVNRADEKPGNRAVRLLYENNKSISPAIRAQITKELGVEPVLINSALLSAQSRQRLYWAGRRGPDGTYSQVSVEQPADRGILLLDILEGGTTWKEKAYTLRASAGGHQGLSNILRSITTNGKFGYLGVAEPVNQSRLVVDEAAISLTANGDWQHNNFVIVAADGKGMPVYCVRDGQITIKGKQYPIKLADGFYIIRKFTVTECKRLQTVPDNYIFPVSDTQAYKMLGNGWTVDVIEHILSRFDGITKRPVDVLSMYDGMSCGHLALDKLGATVARYHATEIDRYAIQTTQANYPNTVQLGDAFQVRAPCWDAGGLFPVARKTRRATIPGQISLWR